MQHVSESATSSLVTCLSSQWVGGQVSLLVSQSVGQSVGQSVRQLVRQSVGQSVRQSVGQSDSQSNSQSNSQSVSQSVGQSCKVSQIIGQTISQSSQWVKRSVNRWSASHLNGQSPSQLASRPVSWTVSQLISRHSFKSLSVRKPASDLFDLFVLYHSSNR